MPAELANARWGIKLALAIGLGLLPSRHRSLFDRVATIRNRLAHGEIVPMPLGPRLIRTIDASIGPH